MRTSTQSQLVQQSRSPLTVSPITNRCVPWSLAGNVNLDYPLGFAANLVLFPSILDSDDG
jgi:hypothetical protein